MDNFIAWIVVANFLLYFKTLRYKFVSDDLAVSKKPPEIRGRFHRRWLQFIGAYKHFGWTFRIVKDQGKWKLVGIKTEEQEHLIALLFHTLACVMIYLAFGRDQISFMAALLYSVNAANNQGTIWPGGRGYVIPILCLLATMIVPILALPALLLCSWFTVGFLAPLTLIGFPGFGVWWYVLAIIPVVWIVHARKFRTAVVSKASSEAFTEDKKIHPKKLIIGIKTFGFYLVLCLFNHRITFYHNFLQSMAGSGRERAYKLDRYFLIGILGILGIAGYIYVNGWNLLSWALVAWCVGIAPFCNLVRNNQEAADRFSALPNVFLMLALAIVISPFPVVCAAWVAWFAARTYYTLTTYKDEYFITEMAVVEDPHAWWAWHCRAMKRWDTQSYKEALILWTMARLISPKEFKVLMNLATCLRLLKIHAEADQFLAMAEANIVPGQEEQAREYIAQHRSGNMPILL